MDRCESCDNKIPEIEGKLHACIDGVIRCDKCLGIVEVYGNHHLKQITDLTAQVEELRIAAEMLLYSVENVVSEPEFVMTVRNIKDAIAKAKDGE